MPGKLTHTPSLHFPIAPPPFSDIYISVEKVIIPVDGI